MSFFNPVSAVRSYSSDFKRLQPETRFLLGGIMLNSIGSGFVLPFLTIYFHSSIGISYAVAGLLIGLRSGISLGAKMVSGYTSDNIGRKKTLLASLGTLVVSYGMYVWASTLPELAVAVSIQGVGIGLFWPANSSYISDLESEFKERAFAVQRAFKNGGNALGIAVGGILASISYEVLFYGDAAMTAAFLGVAAFKLSESLSDSSKDRGYDFGRILSDTDMWKLFTIHTVFVVLVSQLFNMIPPFLREVGSYPEFVIGNLFLVNAGLVFVYQLRVTDAIESYGQKTVFTGAFVCWLAVAAMFLMHPLAGIAVVPPALALIAASQMAFIPKASDMMSSLAIESETGLYMAMISASWSFGLIAGPAIAGALLDIQPYLMWYFVLLVATGGAAMSLLMDIEVNN